MTGMAKNNPYLDFLIEEFAPLGQIHTRAMFGGHCLYCNGIVFALLADQSLYLKVDAANRPAFEALGLTPSRPFPDSDLVMQYYPAPAETFDSPEGLRRWAGGAVAAGLRAKKPAKKTRPPKAVS